MRLSVSIALALALAAGWATGGAGQAAAQTPFRPVAVVNDSAITGYDLAQRALILGALGYPAEDTGQLQTAALDQLVEDKLKLQAGEQIGVTATPELIASGVEEYARRAGMTPEAFRSAMRGRGVTDQALDDMVAAQVVWLDVIRRRFGDRVQPAEAEIDAEMAVSGGGTTEYRVLEIGLPLTADGRSEAETRALAQELSASLAQGGDFGAAVASYSGAPSAARGGEVGWVTTDRMPPELRQTLAQLEVGQVSPPLPVAGGLSILKLVDKRQTAGTPAAEPRSREEVRNALITERSDRLAEGLLQEMRRDALIEVR
jgi:peptidyl-prolyl cis-trans isomerase SurA